MKTWYKNKAFYVKKSEKSGKWIFFEVLHNPNHRMSELEDLPPEILREYDAVAFPTRKQANEEAYKRTNKMVNEHIAETRGLTHRVQ
jgi:hypothetical protein